ncbi:MAG: antibiotic biosynthesis monooxygenase [Actinomycetota bacterium]|nr:antibiotic biosynthesis monooxygenase [Actinomycetota bacterium]
MLAVIIEFEINAGMEEETESISEFLATKLEGMDGFISADAASSLGLENVLYELSFWRDEAALEAWAKHPDHLAAKAKGRAHLFKWYRIRVATVTRDWGS